MKDLIGKMIYLLSISFISFNFFSFFQAFCSSQFFLQLLFLYLFLTLDSISLFWLQLWNATLLTNNQNNFLFFYFLILIFLFKSLLSILIYIIHQFCFFIFSIYCNNLSLVSSRFLKITLQETIVLSIFFIISLYSTHYFDCKFEKQTSIDKLANSIVL